LFIFSRKILFRKQKLFGKSIVRDLNPTRNNYLSSFEQKLSYLVMYSFGILGSWWLKMFCKAINHSMMFFGTRSVSELEITWN